MALFAQKNSIRKLFTSETAEDDIAAFADKVKRQGRGAEGLVALLPENHPMYKGRGANQVVRIRGYIMAAFETAGLPAAALIYVFDELENSRSAYSVAAASKALRGLKEPMPQAAPFLLKAVCNIRTCDEALTFETYKPQWPVNDFTTALNEIFLTFQWMGAYARESLPQLKDLLDGSFRFNAAVISSISKAIEVIENDHRQVGECCSIDLPRGHPEGKEEKELELLKDIALEDQDGTALKYKDHFTGSPTVVAFFYTRCNNPNKCSLTVAKMAQLQKVLKEKGVYGKVNIALVSYDPGYDNAERLKAYGQSRGIIFDQHTKALRVDKDSFDRFRDVFELGVNFSGSIVNQHQIELFILDRDGKMSHSFTRLQWEIDEVVGEVMKAVKRKPGVVGAFKRSVPFKIAKQAWAVMPPILVAFFPKCPMCWAAYLSLFGVTGLNTIPYSPWLLPVFIVIMGINLFALARGAKRRNGMLPFYISLSGAVILSVLGLIFKIKFALYPGILLIFTGSLLNALPFSFYLRLRKVAVFSR